MSNITPATGPTLVVVEWMINDENDGFQETSVPSKGGPSQFVSISPNDIKNHPGGSLPWSYTLIIGLTFRMSELDAIKKKIDLATATIDKQVGESRSS